MRMPVIALMALTMTGSGSAQDWSWPEKPQNLKVLPEEWPGSRLSPVMRGFTRSLGVRCSYCHLGEEGKPLSTYDFVSDENPNKDRAREMLRMLGSVNDHLKKIEPSGDQAVNMWCHTCHRGRPRPMTLGEEISEQYRLRGVDAALAHEQSLRDRFYGRGAYDFTNEDALNLLGYQALETSDFEGAIRVFRLNTERFPESANAWDSLGEGYMRSGRNEEAIQVYRKSLELNPANRNAKEMIATMKGEE
ncbi:MAG: c-type cytochrome [Ignavibacteria bacterium]|nr:c-type cytochrome [Ignavibacteria bacterium]